MMIVLTLHSRRRDLLFRTRLVWQARVAVLAVALFVLEPTVLAHGRIVHHRSAGVVSLSALLLRFEGDTFRCEQRSGRCYRFSQWCRFDDKVLDDCIVAGTDGALPLLVLFSLGDSVKNASESFCIPLLFFWLCGWL